MTFLLRSARQSAAARTLRAPLASFRPAASATLQRRAYANEKGQAQPKILDQSPPDEKDAPHDVKKHNEEMAKRADRPQEKVKGEDVAKDTVPKGYWGGSQAGENKESG